MGSRVTCSRRYCRDGGVKSYKSYKSYMFKERLYGRWGQELQELPVQGEIVGTVGSRVTRVTCSRRDCRDGGVKSYKSYMFKERL